MPTLLAICMAWGHCKETQTTDQFSLWLSIIALVGIVCAHLCTNLLDDYFDYKNAGIESRERLNRAGMRARIGKAPYLAEGRATLRDTLRAASVFGAIAVIMGVVIALYRGWPVVLIAGIGLLLGFFYSAKPIAIGYRGLGELDTGLMFGPLLMMGTSIAAGGALFGSLIWMSIAVGLLVTNIVYTHSIMDADADRSVGKQTLATLLGTKRRQLVAEWVFNFVPPLIVIGCVICHVMSPAFLLSLLSLPISLALYRSMKDFYREKETAGDTAHPTASPYHPRWWMGNMAHWDDIVKLGIDWFMYRWYLARNYITLFVLLAAIATFIG